MLTFLSISFLQIALVTAAQVSNLTGWGIYRPGVEYETFLNASRHPITQNTLQFQGFNFTPITDPYNPPATNSDETWRLQLNYSSVTLASDGNGNTEVVGYPTFGLEFPEGELPYQNATPWRLCGHFLATPFPSNISSIEGPIDSSNGSCIPYLGQDCVNAYSYALANARRDVAGCPLSPSFTDLPACAAQLGHLLSASTTTSALMNFTDPNVMYFVNNQTFLDAETLEPVNGTFHGLQSGVPFAYQTSDITADPQAGAIAATSQLRLMALSLGASPEYYQNVSNSGQGFAYPDTNIRLLCGRAVHTNSATASRNGSQDGRKVSAVTLGLAFAVSIAASVW